MVKILTLLLISGQISAMTIPLTLGELCTPDNKDFIGYRYKENIPICERNVSVATKNKVCERDGVKDRTNYIVDHFNSLSMGGSNDINNLWCEPKSLNTASKEAELYNQLKNGTKTQKEVLDELYKLKISIIKKLNKGE